MACLSGSNNSPAQESNATYPRLIPAPNSFSFKYCTPAPVWVGASSFVVKDKKMLHRLELLDKIDDDDRETILKVVDNYLTSAQLQTTSKKLKQKA